MLLQDYTDNDTVTPLSDGIRLVHLPSDTLPLIAQYLDTLKDRLHLRHTCSFLYDVSNMFASQFFNVSDGYGESFVIVSTDTDLIVQYFATLSDVLRYEWESSGKLEDGSGRQLRPFTRMLLSWIVRGSSRLTEQYGFSFSKHVTDGFFYCMMRNLLDETTPREIVDLFLSECRFNSSFWNTIDRIVGYVYPRTLFYEAFVRLSKSGRLSQMLPLLHNEAGIQLFAIDFYPNQELIQNSSGLIFNHSVSSFTVVHLAAWLRDWDALKQMHSMNEGVINTQTHQRRTALDLCLEDASMYDVALFLLENFPAAPRRMIPLDETHPLASRIAEIIIERGETLKNSSEETTLEDLDAFEEEDLESLRYEYDRNNSMRQDRLKCLQIVEDYNSDEDSIELRDEQGLDIQDLIDDDISTIEKLGQQFETPLEEDSGDGDEDWFKKKDVLILSRKPYSAEDESLQSTTNDESSEEEPKAKKPKLVHGIVSREELVIPKSIFRQIAREVLWNYSTASTLSPAALLTLQHGCELFLSRVIEVGQKCKHIDTNRPELQCAQITLEHKNWSMRDVCDVAQPAQSASEDDSEFDSDFSSISSDTCRDIYHVSYYDENEEWAYYQ